MKVDDYPKISVIMPAYNAERFIRDAIESVLAQTWTNRELIVIDDGSVDRTGEIAKGYGDRVRYIYQENARQAAARNRGIKVACGEYLAFIDADDVWIKDKLEKQLELLRANPGLGLVSCSVTEIDENGRQLGFKSTNLRGHVLRSILLGEGTAGINGSTALIPAAVLARIGDFDPDLTPVEDTDLFCRIAAEYPIDYVDESLVLYRLHSGNDHKKVRIMEVAWRRFYRKILRLPAVESLGWGLRMRCKGRLYYMLAGDHALAGDRRRALVNGIKAMISWPPIALKLIGKM